MVKVFDGPKFFDGQISAVKDQQLQLLPAFPEFDASWPMLTQVEWLQTYRELFKRT